jgi:hypothetical protein
MPVAECLAWPGEDPTELRRVAMCCWQRVRVKGRWYYCSWSRRALGLPQRHDTHNNHSEGRVSDRGRAVRLNFSGGW